MLAPFGEATMHGLSSSFSELSRRSCELSTNRLRLPVYGSSPFLPCRSFVFRPSSYGGLSDFLLCGRLFLHHVAPLKRGPYRRVGDGKGTYLASTPPSLAKRFIPLTSA